VSLVFPLEPFDFVYLLLDLERLEVIEFRFVALKCRVNGVVAALRRARLRQFLTVLLEYDDATALVARRQQLPVVVEFNAGNNICLRHIILLHGAFHLREAPLRFSRREAVDVGDSRRRCRRPTTTTSHV